MMAIKRYRQLLVSFKFEKLPQHNGQLGSEFSVPFNELFSFDGLAMKELKENCELSRVHRELSVLFS